MDKASGAKSGNGPTSQPQPNQKCAQAGAAKVVPKMPSGNTGSYGAQPLKSGNKG